MNSTNNTPQWVQQIQTDIFRKPCKAFFPAIPVSGPSVLVEISVKLLILLWQMIKYSSVEGYQYKISNWVERLIGNEIIKKDIFIYKADCNSSNQSHDSMWVK